MAALLLKKILPFFIVFFYSPQIIHGQGGRIDRTTLERDYPFIANLHIFFNDPDRYRLTTGTLVSKDTVLSTADCHCNGTRYSNNVEVRMKSIYHDGDGVEYSKLAYINPPYHKCQDGYYSLYPMSDYMLIKLKKPVIGLRPVPIVCGVPPVDQKPILVGYGTKSSSRTSGDLRMFHTKFTECPVHGGGNIYCTENRDANAGDSGGPLLVTLPEHERQRLGKFGIVGIYIGQHTKDGKKYGLFTKTNVLCKKIYKWDLRSGTFYDFSKN